MRRCAAGLCHETVVQNTFNVQRHLIYRETLHLFRAEAMRQSRNDDGRLTVVRLEKRCSTVELP